MATRADAMPEWLAPALAYIDSWLGFQHRVLRLPGISVAIARGQSLALQRAYGTANAVTNERLTPRHRFRVASHSKTFTATGVMKLVDQRRVRLDDVAGQYVDGLAPDVARTTLAQLLSHTAGICRDGTDAGQWVDRRPFLAEAELRAELAQPTAIAPNTRMKYSNHGFGLVGMVIAAVTGEPYAQWIAREVVAASGLRDTAPDMPIGGKAPFSRGHTGTVLTGHRHVIPGENPTNALAAATGFVSTASDLARFYAQLDPAAPISVISVESRREMTRRHWRVPELPIELHYGLGVVHVDFGSAEWSGFGHSGGFQGYLTQTTTIPAQGLTVSVLTNAADAVPALLLEGCVRILQAFASRGAPAADLADWRGRWWSLWGATDLVAMGNQVLVTSPALANPIAGATVLTPTGPDTARITSTSGFGSFGEDVRLHRDARGRVTRVQLAGSQLLPERAAARDIERRYGEGVR